MKVVLLKVPAVRQVARGIRGLAAQPARVVRETQFVAQTIGSLRSVGCMIVGGGGPLSDDIGGSWALPFTVLKWTIMARIAGSRVLFVNVGAGPLDARLARIFIKLALRLSAYQSFRDEGSQALMASLGITGSVHADLAWALPLEKPPGEAAPRGSLVVGLNPFPYQDSRYWPGGERSRYEAYLDAIATLAQGLRENGHTVVLFPTQLRSDPLVIRDITARLAAWNSRGLPVPLEQPTIETLSDLVATLRSLDLIVSGHFHGVLLGLRLGKPVVALSYQPKTVELVGVWAERLRRSNGRHRPGHPHRACVCP